MKLTRKVKGFVVLLLVSALLGASAPRAAADTGVHVSGIFSYVVLSDGTAEITGVDFAQGQTELDIPESLDGYTVTSIGYYAMNNYAALESVKLPQTLVRIGNGAFSLCKSLTRVDLPSGLKVIDTAAFFGCSSLVYIDIPDGVQSVGNTAFRQCRSLASVSIPESVVSIGKMAFFECDSLSVIMLPQSLEAIGDTAFGCYLDDGIKSDDSFLIIGRTPIAQGYADGNGLLYRDLSRYIRGDTNTDGAVTIRDVTEIQRRLAQMHTPVFDPIAADVDGGGTGIDDATHIQMYLAEYDNICNIGEYANA